MRKFTALFINEMIKLTRRVLVVVGLIALLVIPLLVFVMSKQSYTEPSVGKDSVSDIEYADEYVARLELQYESMLEDWGGDPGLYYDFYGMYELERAAKMLEIAEDLRDREPRKLRLAYISNLIDSVANAHSMITVRDDIVNSDLSEDEKEDRLQDFEWSFGIFDLEEYETIQQTAEQAIESGTLDDYVAYISRVGSRYSSDYSEEAQETFKVLWAKVQVDDETLYSSQAFGVLERTIESYIERQEGLSQGIFSNEPVTPQLEAQLEKEMKLILYQIENPGFINANTGISSDYYYSQPAATRAFNNSFTFVFLILVIGMLILAASTVSQEIETGTIKALIISPTKRYKIILAKFIALVAVALTLFLISVAWIAILSFLFYGANSLPGMLTVLGGEVLAFTPLAAAFVRMLICFVQVVIFIIIGMALSTTMRHTAMAVGLSIGLFFANMIAQLILMTRQFSETFRLLPFLNIDFSGRIGASIPDSLMGGYSLGHYSYIPLQYSVIYTLVFAFLLLWITFDSFIRRDI